MLIPYEEIKLKNAYRYCQLIKKNKVMRITYQIEDGYAGASRPRYIEVNDQDLEECETMAEKEELITDMVLQDFEEKVYPVWDKSQLKTTTL